MERPEVRRPHCDYRHARNRSARVSTWTQQIDLSGAGYGRCNAPSKVDRSPAAAERKLARQAIELDPLTYQARNNLARILFVEGKLDEAEASARKAAELQPTAASSRRWLVFVAIHRGDGEAALREAEREPDEGYRHFELALAHYARGDRPAADAALAELIARDAKVEAYQIAQVYAWRGETEKAFEWLQIAFDHHDTGMLGLLIDPLMRSLHDDARYKGLLVKMGLPVPL